MNPFLADLNEFTFTRLAKLLAGVSPPAGLKPINLSIGEPKHPTPKFIGDALTANTDGLAQYPPTKGSLALRQSIASWVAKRFALPALNAETQVLPVVGTKEALYSFTQLIVDPRRDNPTVLVPNPFYMVYEGAAMLCGATPYFVNLDATTGQYAWDDIPDAVWRNVQLVIVCSPDNPTGTITTKARWKWLFEKSDQYGFVLLADECYSEIYFDESKPPHGALQVAAELGRSDFKRLVAMGSLSKRSNAPGLRSGFVAGDADIIAKFLHLRSFNGSAMAATVAAASIAAWSDESHVIANRAEYAKKFQQLTPLLAKHVDVKIPEAAFYWWFPIPARFNADDAAFARDLFAATGVTVIPGSYLSRVGPNGVNPGKGFIRIALVSEFDECHEAVLRLCEFLNEKRVA
ncbi:MAG: succinyldiaminopimelate transaminase [Betaproteobacteria bacterium]|nr:MAG: succinyldiaminopimelate transaminase [Betaproteobacteria bacterium]